MIGICGASGYIGQELCRLLSEKKKRYMGTYCKNYKEGLLPFDMRSDSFDIFNGCNFVVILSAYCKIRWVDDNRVDAYELNVFRTKALLDHLNEKGIPALFVSSDAAERKNTVYGKYKRYVERHIRDNWLKATYIRPGKVDDDNISAVCGEIYAHIKPGRRQKIKT